MLRALYLVIIAVCILPTIPGLLGVVVSALGYVPLSAYIIFHLMALMLCLTGKACGHLLV